MAILNNCPRQKEIVEFLKSKGVHGATENEILLEVYGVDRKRNSWRDNNKAGADALRRALANGFVMRTQVFGKRHYYEYFVGRNA